MKPLPAEHDPEVPVIQAIRDGDPLALAELMHRQGRWVRGVVLGAMGRAEDVDDVVQRVWIRVWQQAGRLEDGNRWRSWLYRIARNCATDAGRSRKRRRRLHQRLWEAILRRGRHELSPDRRLAAREAEARMLAAIEALPALYREPFVLKHLEGWSYRQIGQLLDLPVDTVETRLVRARRLLRQQLAGKV
jgi:RNA polymerase sigma-70 factor, ECF subfamily